MKYIIPFNRSVRFETHSSCIAFCVRRKLENRGTKECLRRHQRILLRYWDWHESLSQVTPILISALCVVTSCLRLNGMARHYAPSFLIYVQRSPSSRIHSTNQSTVEKPLHEASHEDCLKERKNRSNKDAFINPGLGRI